MPMLPDSVQSLSRPPFRNYQFDAAYDEMFEAPGKPRPHYQALFRTLLELPPEELRKSQQAADLSFLHQGITFTVYGNEQGTERVFPNGLPRSTCFSATSITRGESWPTGLYRRNSSIAAATTGVKCAT